MKGRLRRLAAVLALPAALCVADAAELVPITEKDFVCHGKSGRPIRFQGKDYHDCAGGHLPKDGLDPKLVRLLNQLQSRLKRQLVVTSGYRCETHNLYSWAHVAMKQGDTEGVSRDSLHRSGAAADFYIFGELDLKQYKKAEKELYRLEPGRLWTKVYSPREVRDPDNLHDYPYIHVGFRGAPRTPSPPAEPTQE